MSDLWQLALVLGLVVVNALFAGSEIALISLRQGQIDRFAKRDGAGRALARLAAIRTGTSPPSRSRSRWRAFSPRRRLQ